MEKISFYSVIILNTIISVRYCYLTAKKRISPSLAMWVFFLIAVIGSLFSYLLDGDFSPMDNILNTADILLCTSIIITILFFGEKSSLFNRFDIICLGGVLLILFFWFFSKAHFVTNLSLQLIQAIGYIPVVNRMGKAKKNNESFLTWILLFLVTTISFFTAKGILAFIYSARALICISLLLFLMVRIELKKKSIQPKIQFDYNEASTIIK